MKIALFDDEESRILETIGFPSFDEFRRNPDKWRTPGNSAKELLTSADGGTVTFRKQVKKTTYWWRDQYQVKSPEQLERIAKEEGFSGNLEYEVLVEPLHGTDSFGAMHNKIRFWPVEEFRLRGGIVANE